MRPRSAICLSRLVLRLKLHLQTFLLRFQRLNLLVQPRNILLHPAHEPIQAPDAIKQALVQARGVLRLQLQG